MGRARGWCARVARLFPHALLFIEASLAAAAATAQTAPLILRDVGDPVVVGSGQGERALWTNAGTVGGVSVDLVAVMRRATRDHDFRTGLARPNVLSSGQDDVWVEWRIYEAGSYNIATGSGGRPVVADVHVQFNDVDGPNNERVFVPVCGGDVGWVRIDKRATLGRRFGTVAGRTQILSLIGDKNYDNTTAVRESGLEVFYPKTSVFEIGRTGNSGFGLRLDSPSYSAFDTLDYQCSDFQPLAVGNDRKEGVPGSPTVLDILVNDSVATLNNNPPHNNSRTASENARASVTLIPPPGATSIVTGQRGTVIGFTTPGEGLWEYDETTGLLTFTPDPSFKGYAAPVKYTVRGATGELSPEATVTVWYPAIGVTKASAFNDANGDGYGQVGETITYTYRVTAYGAEPLRQVSLTETGFTGGGAAPTPVLQAGDTDGDGLLDLSETWTYTATYALVAGDFPNGVRNLATAQGRLASGAVVTDRSDSLNPGDGDGRGTPGPGPANDEATLTRPALAPIAAENDAQTGAIFAGGRPNAFNLVANDRFKGAAPVFPQVTLAQLSSSDAGVSIDTATGELSVAAGTPVGTHTLRYRICEAANSNNCASAVATVMVSPATPILADDDAVLEVASATGGANLADIFANDRLNGAALVPADVLTTFTPASVLGVTLNAATGQVSIAPGTPIGSYSVPYRICERVNPVNCDTATVTVVVRPNAIAATDDTVAGVKGASAAPNLGSAFANDRLNGVAVAPVDVIATVTAPATPVRAGAPAPTLDPATGIISAPASTPAGNYTIGYRICEAANPANCAAATISIQVVSATIAAANDFAGPVSSATGGADAVNALANDTLNGAAAAPPDVVISVVSPATDPGVALAATTGVISVARGTPAGDYAIGYRICERLNPANCATAIVTVSVTLSPVAAANDGPVRVNGAVGRSEAVNAFGNDTLNGAPINLADITARVATPARPGAPTLDPATGLVAVPAATPAGDYAIRYIICERVNPTNCGTAIVSLIVTAAPIAAAPDTAGPVNGATGAPTLLNALSNDSLNDAPVEITDVALSVTSPASHPGVTLDPATGLIAAASGTPAGTYAIGYRICEKLNPSNCAASTATVAVTTSPIAAADDEVGPIGGSAGGASIRDVLANDGLSARSATLAQITLTITSPAAHPGVTLAAATGLVSVSPGTPGGRYTIGYVICERLNPANCAGATITARVTAADIMAVADAPAPVRSGVATPKVTNALANDTLNGVVVPPGGAVVSVTASPADPGVSLDTATGDVSVTASVPAGAYRIAYRICETINPLNCSDAAIAVTVEPPVSAVSGTVFTDSDGDDRLDPDEPRRPNWIVEVVRDGAIVATARTGADGEYRIADLPSGAGYSVVFRSPENNVVYDRIDGVSLGAAATVVDQNQPIDPSGLIYDALTRAPVRGALVALVDASGASLPVACFVDPSQRDQTTGATGEYRFDLRPGAAAQCPAGERDYRIAVTPPAGYAPASTVLPPRPGPFDPTGMPPPVRISPAATPPTDADPRYFLTFRLAAGDPDIVNNHVALDPFLTRTPLLVTKTSPRRTAAIGDLVPYEITVRNRESVRRAGVAVVDILPPGMRYVPGTGLADGRAEEPERAGRQLRWPGQMIPANGAVRYTLTLVVGAGVTGGDRVNTGLARDGVDGPDISNRGTAVIAVTPSAVFDCSELLGAVFEDRDRDGRRGLGEPGVAGARLADVNGRLVTTDAHGRFHIACAAVPHARLGSNYVLKLDTRSLPLGWATTTENPRSIRLTRGKFGELDFGVAPAIEAARAE